MLQYSCLHYINQFATLPFAMTGFISHKLGANGHARAPTASRHVYEGPDKEYASNMPPPEDQPTTPPRTPPNEDSSEPPESDNGILGQSSAQ